MSMNSRVVQPADIEEVLNFEEQKLVEKFPDESQRIFASWEARWRKEALEHYFSLGWSFLIRERDKESSWSNEGLLLGYFIAQPILFFGGQTQTLWIEHIQHTTLEARDALCDLAVRLCKDKHIQRVIFPGQISIKNSLSAFKPEIWHTECLVIKTTKS